MVCSEPLISKDAPPQWKCICRATYSVPSEAVMRMVGGRLICTGREGEGQRGEWAGRACCLGSLPGHLLAPGAWAGSPTRGVAGTQGGMGTKH